MYICIYEQQHFSSETGEDASRLFFAMNCEDIFDLLRNDGVHENYLYIYPSEKIYFRHADMIVYNIYTAVSKTNLRNVRTTPLSFISPGVTAVNRYSGQ